MKAVILLCAGLAVVPAVADARALTASEKAMIRTVVTKDFKDPTTARFKWLPIIDRAKWLSDPDHAGGSKFISCGLVNGKNSYGGYTGFVPFAVGITAEKDKIVGVDLIGIAQGDQATVDYIPRLCEDGQDIRSAR